MSHLSIIRELKKRLRFNSKRCKMIVVGSIRRGEPPSDDIDFLVITPSVSNATLAPSSSNNFIKIISYLLSGPKHSTISISDHKGALLKIDLFSTTLKQLPFALFHWTGPRSYNIRTRAHAQRKGLRLNQYGIFNAKSGRHAYNSLSIRTEEDIAHYLGLTPRQPNDRK